MAIQGFKSGIENALHSGLSHAQVMGQSMTPGAAHDTLSLSSSQASVRLTRWQKVKDVFKCIWEGIRDLFKSPSAAAPAASASQHIPNIPARMQALISHPLYFRIPCDQGVRNKIDQDFAHVLKKELEETGSLAIFQHEWQHSFEVWKEHIVQNPDALKQLDQILKSQFPDHTFNDLDDIKRVHAEFFEYQLKKNDHITKDSNLSQAFRHLNDELFGQLAVEDKFKYYLRSYCNPTGNEKQLTNIDDLKKLHYLFMDRTSRKAILKSITDELSGPAMQKAYQDVLAHQKELEELQKQLKSASDENKADIAQKIAEKENDLQEAKQVPEMLKAAYQERVRTFMASYKEFAKQEGLLKGTDEENFRRTERLLDNEFGTMWQKAKYFVGTKGLEIFLGMSSPIELLLGPDYLAKMDPFKAQMLHGASNKGFGGALKAFGPEWATRLAGIGPYKSGLIQPLAKWGVGGATSGQAIREATVNTAATGLLGSWGTFIGAGMNHFIAEHPQVQEFEDKASQYLQWITGQKQ